MNATTTAKAERISMLTDAQRATLMVKLAELASEFGSAAIIDALACGAEAVADMAEATNARGAVTYKRIARELSLTRELVEITDRASVTLADGLDVLADVDPLAMSEG